jgi:hypothetical protein
MIVSEGYSIEYMKAANKIIINLPQTMGTVTNTVTPMSDRKTDFTDDELCAILYAVKMFAEMEREARCLKDATTADTAWT